MTPQSLPEAALDALGSPESCRDSPGPPRPLDVQEGSRIRVARRMSRLVEESETTPVAQAQLRVPGKCGSPSSASSALIAASASAALMHTASSTSFSLPSLFSRHNWRLLAGCHRPGSLGLPGIAAYG